MDLTDDDKGCPDCNTLAEYVEGKLSKPETDYVTIHLTQCPDCYEIVTTILDLRLGDTL
jgi:anti-sigma factor ChrR (cupin superfamily)